MVEYSKLLYKFNYSNKLTYCLNSSFLYHSGNTRFVSWCLGFTTWTSVELGSHQNRYKESSSLIVDLANDKKASKKFMQTLGSQKLAPMEGNFDVG